MRVTLSKALALDKQRRATNATADNLYERVQGDPRFTDVRRLPELRRGSRSAWSSTLRLFFRKSPDGRLGQSLGAVENFTG